MSIRFFDMFAGIGGFRSGLEAAGSFECVGHCEIDKYANKAYNAIVEWVNKWRIRLRRAILKDIFL